MKKKTKRTWIEYGVIAAIALTLYMTGLHTEVIGFVQKGVLATGLMNPKVESGAKTVSDHSAEMADLGFSLLNSAGETVRMEEFKGKAIFINLWATWCPPCIAEMPGIQKLYSEVKDENVEFIMISLDDDFEKALEYRKRKEYDFEVYRVQNGLPEMYHSTSIPTTYVIGADGTLAMTHRGMANYHTNKFKKFLRAVQ